ncbi:MAG: UDP-N-acetylglucosamine--N-acetylmuramyl-(pentapeptide) pyrophosphoryl-undecaprenol N-acetylglucosamine transferase [Proteobacteria bacterium]|nr:UDP-N-acetylglucosamine--N-acetylmuramyl-(pentapeptide) pyrophosphoryl-undecaprenol N-acetylglucosamine transferase [Pseudomonadota bacterium]
MRGPRVIPIVIAAGGTGGHFFPAEALAVTLAGRGFRPVLMTDGRSAGRGSEAFAAGDRHVLPGAGIAGRGMAKGVKAVGALAAGTVAAARILRPLNAGAIVGFGGYPSVPPVMAARLGRLRLPVILHEQNAVLGRANRALSRFATVLALSASPTARVPSGARSEIVGNPVRPAIAALAGLAYAPPEDEGPINLLVTGGSLGARVLSEVVPTALIGLAEHLRRRLHVVQQARQEDAGAVRAAYAGAGIVAEVAPFFPDIPRHLGAAHLVIARAGASTTAELSVAGRPAILVPLPSAIDDHQSANAAMLGDAGAAWVVPQARFTANALTTQLALLLNDPRALTAAAAAARSLARVSAVDALADLVERSMVRETQS